MTLSPHRGTLPTASSRERLKFLGVSSGYLPLHTSVGGVPANAGEGVFWRFITILMQFYANYGPLLLGVLSLLRAVGKDKILLGVSILI